MNIEKMVRRWEQFETDLASHDKWINEISKRAWNKKNTLNNIEKIVEQRNTCKRNCNEIKTYQKHIEDFFTTANNLEEISGSTNVKTSMNRIQNEFSNIKDNNDRDLEEIEAILVVIETYEQKLQEATQWLDDFETKVDGCSDIKIFNDDVRIS